MFFPLKPKSSGRHGGVGWEKELQKSPALAKIKVGCRANFVRKILWPCADFKSCYYDSEPLNDAQSCGRPGALKPSPRGVQSGNLLEAKMPRHQSKTHGHVGCGGGTPQVACTRQNFVTKILRPRGDFKSCFDESEPLNAARFYGQPKANRKEKTFRSHRKW